MQQDRHQNVQIDGEMAENNELEVATPL